MECCSAFPTSANCEMAQSVVRTVFPSLLTDFHQYRADWNSGSVSVAKLRGAGGDVRFEAIGSNKARRTSN